MTNWSDKKPRREAVALAYASDDDVPRVVAQGYGEIAERIIAEARQHGIFVHDSPELVGLLMQLNIDESIPPQLYQVIAELLVWLSNMEKGTELSLPQLSG